MNKYFRALKKAYDQSGKDDQLDLKGGCVTLIVVASIGMMVAGYAETLMYIFLAVYSFLAFAVVIVIVWAVVRAAFRVLNAAKKNLNEDDK